MFVVITLIVLLARDISELGKIPLRGMRTLRVRLYSRLAINKNRL